MNLLTFIPNESYQAPVSRFDGSIREEPTAYGNQPAAMGFFAPRDNFGGTLQAATATPNPAI